MNIGKLFEKDWYWRKYRNIIVKLLPAEMANDIIIRHNVKQTFKYTFGKSLNLHNPKDLNEKLLWLAFNWHNPLVVACADKLKVRDYVKQCGLEHILVPIYKEYDNVFDLQYFTPPC